MTQLKYTFSFTKVSEGSIEIHAESIPLTWAVREAIQHGTPHIGNAEYKDIKLEYVNAIELESKGKDAPRENNQGYEIMQAYNISKTQGIALAKHPNAPDPYVTWQYTQDENGLKDYYWGHYFSNGRSAQKDFYNRINDHNKEIEASELSIYRYYSTQRPVDIGTFPKTNNEPLEIVNFNSRVSVENGDFIAWGYLEYAKPLTLEQMGDYELRPASANADMRVAIREKAQVVGQWEEMKQMPDNERYTWYKPSIQKFELRVPVVSPKQMSERFRQAEYELIQGEKQHTIKPINEQLAEARKKIAYNEQSRTERKPLLQER
jgi:hypothetical protein